MAKPGKKACVAPNRKAAPVVILAPEVPNLAFRAIAPLSASKPPVAPTTVAPD